MRALTHLESVPVDWPKNSRGVNWACRRTGRGLATVRIQGIFLLAGLRAFPLTGPTHDPGSTFPPRSLSSHGGVKLVPLVDGDLRGVFDLCYLDNGYRVSTVTRAWSNTSLRAKIERVVTLGTLFRDAIPLFPNLQTVTVLMDGRAGPAVHLLLSPTLYTITIPIQ